MPGDLHSMAFAATHVGLVRSNNEDACALPGWASDSETERWHGHLPADGGWALVADGMGGHAFGEVASEMAVELLRPMMASLADRPAVEDALREANAYLFGAMMARPELGGMGTTLAGVVLHGETALAFNVGDSRIYRHAQGTLSQVSLDHGWGHVLTQCLGGASVPVELDPFVDSVGLGEGTRLLLCSDGLTDMLDDGEIARLLDDREGDPAAALVEAALAAGGVDNVTAVVIDAPA